MATFHFIRRGDFDDTLRITEMLVTDGEDLIHKADNNLYEAKRTGRNRICTESVTSPLKKYEKNA